jgi:hypothetical protein
MSERVTRIIGIITAGAALMLMIATVAWWFALTSIVGDIE